jgi:hypothetical protein
LFAVRHGVDLIKNVMKEVDVQGNNDGKISASDVQAFLDAFGDRGTLDDAVRQVHRYMQDVAGTRNPSVDTLTKALSDATIRIGRADADGSSFLDETEQQKLSDTWKAVVMFAKKYEGYTIQEIVTPVGPGPTPKPEPTDPTPGPTDPDPDPVGGEVGPGCVGTWSECGDPGPIGGEGYDPYPVGGE